MDITHYRLVLLTMFANSTVLSQKNSWPLKYGYRSVILKQNSSPTNPAKKSRPKSKQCTILVHPWALNYSWFNVRGCRSLLVFTHWRREIAINVVQNIRSRSLDSPVKFDPTAINICLKYLYTFPDNAPHGRKKCIVPTVQMATECCCRVRFSCSKTGKWWLSSAKCTGGFFRIYMMLLTFTPAENPWCSVYMITVKWGVATLGGTHL